MSGQAAKQSFCPNVVKLSFSKTPRRLERRHGEASQFDRPVWPTRWSEKIGRKTVPVCAQRGKQSPVTARVTLQSSSGCFDRAMDEQRGAVIERMRQRSRR